MSVEGRSPNYSGNLAFGSGPVIGTPPDIGHWTSAPEADLDKVGSGWGANSSTLAGMADTGLKARRDNRKTVSFSNVSRLG